MPAVDRIGTHRIILIPREDNYPHVLRVVSIRVEVVGAGILVVRGAPSRLPSLGQGKGAVDFGNHQVAEAAAQFAYVVVHQPLHITDDRCSVFFSEVAALYPGFADANAYLLQSSQGRLVFRSRRDK